jgi:4-carboxymuconolactone decarboxylase
MSQIPDPTARLTAEAQAIYAKIVGSRGHDYPGLFRSLMNDPALAERFAAFGQLLRFDGVLRADVRELAILTVARDLRVAYEWETHQENARRAGLSAALIAEVLAGLAATTLDRLDMRAAAGPRRSHKRGRSKQFPRLKESRRR